MALPHVSNRNISNQMEVVKMKVLSSRGKPVCSFKSIEDWRFESLLEHWDIRWHTSIFSLRPFQKWNCLPTILVSLNGSLLDTSTVMNVQFWKSIWRLWPFVWKITVIILTILTIDFSLCSQEKNSNSTSLSREKISHNKRNDKYKLKGEYFIFYSVSCVKMCSEGLERRLSSYRLLLFWQTAWAWFPESTWWLPTAYNCFSRDTQCPLLATTGSCMHMVHVNSCRNTHMHK